MFGNHPLPNIVPVHSFHSPPLLPPSCAPAIAHLGQAGAAHHRAPRTHITTDNRRHVMTRKRLHRRQQPPRHCHPRLLTPHHRPRQHPDTMSSPWPLSCHVTQQNRPASLRLPLPSLRDVGAEINGWGVRRGNGSRDA